MLNLRCAAAAKDPSFEKTRLSRVAKHNEIRHGRATADQTTGMTPVPTDTKYTVKISESI